MPIVRLATTRFARLMATFDSTVGKAGTREAARHLLPSLVQGCRQSGAERIPKTGPVLVASNHPGAVDSMVILAALPRTDVKFIVSDVPFLHALPNVKQHCVYATADTDGRLGAMRDMIRHLRTGGTVIIYPGTQLDPDPAILPGAYARLGAWSRSVALLLRHVPETKLAATIVSGVLDPRFLSRRLTHLAPAGWKRQKLAEMLQIMQQLLFSMRIPIQPRVTFGRPITVAELRDEHERTGTIDAIIAHARRVLAQHMSAGDRAFDVQLG